jgi:hypothetical protein
MIAAMRRHMKTVFLILWPLELVIRFGGTARCGDGNQSV